MGVWLLACAVLTLPACVGGGDPPKPVVAQAPPEPDRALRPIEFALNKINIRHGDSIGASKCSYFQDERAIRWEAGFINERSREFDDIFLDAAVAAGVPVRRGSGTLFAPQSSGESADIAVGSVISAIQFKGCCLAYEHGAVVDSGTITMTVSWEIYSRLEDKVVLRLDTAGTLVLAKGTRFDLVTLIARMYRDAAARLVAAPEFRQAVTRRAEARIVAVDAPVAGEKIVLPAAARSNAPIAGSVEQIRRAAVTIDLGAGHGSGFFISGDGWILTNAHVAKGSQAVKVVLSDGQTGFGRVVRVHQARDVALVKMDGITAPVLPLRAQPVVVTEEVFAVGTPIDKKLSGSVTRGIVSEVRTNRRNLTDIQADVAIQPGSSGGPLLDAAGNVVGISYAGYGELNSGLNFFIPIQDALAKLNVSVGGG